MDSLLRVERPVTRDKLAKWIMPIPGQTRETTQGMLTQARLPPPFLLQVHTGTQSQALRIRSQGSPLPAVRLQCLANCCSGYPMSGTTYEQYGRCKYR